MHVSNHARVRDGICQRFGQRIRELRAARELTQEDLAERVGIFRTYMSRIETGVANPTLTLVQALADALGVPVPVLFGDEPPPPGRRASATGRGSRGRVR